MITRPFLHCLQRCDAEDVMSDCGIALGELSKRCLSGDEPRSISAKQKGNAHV